MKSLEIGDYFYEKSNKYLGWARKCIVSRIIVEDNIIIGMGTPAHGHIVKIDNILHISASRNSPIWLNLKKLNIAVD